MREIGLILAGLFIGDLLFFFRAGARAEAWFSRIANRRKLAVLLCAAAAMLPRLLLLPWIPKPEPSIHDEFSYLLGARTLLAGRLTNPTPALWPHFESFHINLVPTYQSMYQPASPLFYALGMLLGHPWWGVWLALGLMCGAMCWALQPLVRPRYAFLAGLLCAMKYGIFTVYSDSFYGGAVPGLGAALALGATVRLISGKRLWNLPVLVLGVALLANSRPFEGLLFALPLAAVLALWILRERQYVRVLLPAAAMLAVLFAGMAYYNLRGTGHALEMPYTANFKQYHFVRPFYLSGVAPMPSYRHYEMASLFAQLEGEQGRVSHTFSGFWKLTRRKQQFYYREHFAPMLLLAFVGMYVALRSPQRRLLTFTSIVVACGLFWVVWEPQSAYPAPLLVSFFGLAMLGTRWLRRLRIGRYKLGPYWARGMVIVLLLFGLGSMYEGGRRGLKQMTRYPLPFRYERARVVRDLEQRGGQHLVLVKYWGFPWAEWVYNSPDIDQQPVIWARSMSDAENCELLRHYAGRRVWLLEPQPPVPEYDLYTPEHAEPWTMLKPYQWPIAPSCN